MAELADGAADAPLLDDTGRLVDPCYAVDLAAEPTDPDTVDRAVAAALRCDRLLIGLADGHTLDAGARHLAKAMDLTLAPRGLAVGSAFVCGELEEVTDAVASAPQAALTLGQVLRATEELSASAALDVESLAYSTLLGGAEFQRWLTERGPRPAPPPAEQPVLIERAGEHLTITLNRPERRNAYGREVRDALVDALRVAAMDDSVRRVLLTGEGPDFCSGGDLDEFGSTPDPATAHFLRTAAGAGLLLDRVAAKVTVEVHGACVGAGIELPAFAARVRAAQGTTFRLPEVSMGLIPGAGGTVSIPRRIGRWRTLWLALTGHRLDARTALSWGLVDAVAE
jgi:hypothetical protein